MKTKKILFKVIGVIFLSFFTYAAFAQEEEADSTGGSHRDTLLGLCTCSACVNSTSQKSADPNTGTTVNRGKKEQKKKSPVSKKTPKNKKDVKANTAAVINKKKGK